MKDYKTLFLKKKRCHAEDCSDKTFYVYPTENIIIEYNHIFINKKRKLLKAIKEYAKKLVKDQYSIVITDDLYYNELDIIGGWVININGKTYTSI